MTECTQTSFEFPACKRRRVEACFDGGDITSDGGVLLLQQADRRLGLSQAVAKDFFTSVVTTTARSYPIPPDLF